MQKFRGHFFNWYDTRTLEPLNPQYISTVDSGNLAGHLIAVKQFCIEPRTLRCSVRARCVELADTIDLISERGRPPRHHSATNGSHHHQTPARRDRSMQRELFPADSPNSPETWATLFHSLGRRAAVIGIDACAVPRARSGQLSGIDLVDRRLSSSAARFCSRCKYPAALGCVSTRRNRCVCASRPPGS